MKDEGLYIIHISESIEHVENFVRDGEDAFMQDVLVQYAVFRALQIMAESTKRLHEETQAKYPDIPWSNIAGFRNILVHDYLGDINLEAVWNVIIDHLPPLKKAIEQEIKDRNLL